ncbi:MAG: SIS domain-containing protein [Candidatus Hodarchaeales archaeon]
MKELLRQTLKEIAGHLTIFSQKQFDESMIKNTVEFITGAGKIFVYGAGRSGMVGRMFAQRLMHLELPSFYLSDAITPVFTKDDVLVVISGSGETLSPVAIAKGAKEIGGKIILLTGNKESTLGNIADILILVDGQTKDAEQKSLAPFTSLFDISALATLDSLARVIMDYTGKTEKDIHRTHASLE